MNKIGIYNMQKELLNMDLIFSFTCKENGKNFVALRNNEEIFEKNSRYANIDIFEIVQVKSKSIFVSDIKDSDWDAVKKSLQFDVFSKMY